MPEPRRGEIWQVDLGRTRGHEQAGTRPGLVLSVDSFNAGPAGLVVVLPLTTRVKGIPFHVELAPPEGGLSERSFIKCEDIRSISMDRLVSPLGAVSQATLECVRERVRILLGM
ncbi:MAG: type II toxin-antitoxin system PemK/MazF family toxin [Candidatus Bipolaricaulota bacterium]|nr:type II toxin-antitoxin system PemK/MazF family toxin [Candidatus Bipolaricaulota bacterium]